MCILYVQFMFASAYIAAYLCLWVISTQLFCYLAQFLNRYLLVSERLVRLSKTKGGISSLYSIYYQIIGHLLHCFSCYDYFLIVAFCFLFVLYVIWSSTLLHQFYYLIYDLFVLKLCYVLHLICFESYSIIIMYLGFI